jgi:hypothetical protein
VKRLLLACGLLLAGALCANAYWQSRGSNYNQNIASGAALSCSYTPKLRADYNVAYTGNSATGSGGAGGYSYSNTGSSLPTGFSIASGTGVISGTDSTDSSGAPYAGIQVTVTDSASATANCSSSFTITVYATLSLSYTPVTTGTQGTLYTGATPSPTGGATPLVYSSTGTAPPSGITLNTSTGVFSGTPSGSGTTTGIVLTITDNIGVSVNSSPFNIAVAATAMTTPIVSGTNLAFSTSVANYASIIGGSGGLSVNSAAIRDLPIAISGTLSNFNMNFVTGAGSGTWAVALSVNGSTTGTPHCTVSANACSDSSDPVSVTAGNLVGLVVTPSSSPTSSTYTQWGATFVSSNSNESFLAGGGPNATTTTVNYSGIQGWSVQGVTTEAVASQVMPTGGTIDNLYVVASAAPGTSKYYDVTVIYNGSPSTITCELTGTGSGAGITTCNDLSGTTGHTQAVSEGDTISILVCPSNVAGCHAGSAPAAASFRWGVRWVPTTAGQSLLLTSSSNAPGTSTTVYNMANGGSTTSTTETQQEVISPVLSGGFSVTKMSVAFSAAPTAGTRTVTLEVGTGSPSTMLCALNASAAASCTPTAVTGIGASTATLLDWKQVSSSATATTYYKVGAVMTVP